MRHRKKFNHLGRKSAHRLETLSSMATALILHKRITTTVAKAKSLRVYVEPLISKSKVDSTHSRRTVFSYLGSKQAVSELFRDVAQKVADRPGGYTRILKTGFRKGDAAEMCIIELVDYNTNMLKTDEETRQKTTRRAGRRRKPDTESPAVKAATKTPAVAAEETVADTEESVAEVAVDQTEAVAEVVVEDDAVAEVTDSDVQQDAADDNENATKEEDKN